MSLVEVVVLVGEGEGCGPEVAGGGVLLQPPAEGIGLTDVSQFATAIRLRTQQHIHARALRFRSGDEFGELGAWNHKPDATPVAFLHDAKAFRNAGGNEHAEGEGLGRGHGGGSCSPDANPTSIASSRLNT